MRAILSSSSIRHIHASLSRKAFRISAFNYRRFIHTSPLNKMRLPYVDNPPKTETEEEAASMSQLLLLFILFQNNARD